jgi:hypothetical protein
MSPSIGMAGPFDPLGGKGEAEEADGNEKAFSSPASVSAFQDRLFRSDRRVGG